MKLKLGNRFKARFNIAILDNGNYLPSGQYLLILKKNLNILLILMKYY